jgi:hypothetical protein
MAAAQNDGLVIERQNGEHMRGHKKMPAVLPA